MRTTSEGRDANRAAVDVTEAAGRIALLMDTKFTRGLLDDVDELAAEVAQLREALTAVVAEVGRPPPVEDRRQHADECEYRGSTLAAVDDCDCGLVVIAEVHKVASAALAAKGAGR